MDNSINFTQKLQEIIKNRKTSLIINKQEKGYKRNRNIIRNLSHESYSYESVD